MKISVIIPVYNVAEWIDKCLESVANQSFTDFEVILIEDGSTDDSCEKCEKWVKQDTRFRIIKQENSGPSIARNRGIEASQGEYLAFIDSDDWVHEEFLTKLYEAALKNNAEMVECDVYRVDDRTGEKSYRNCSGNMNQLYTKREHMKYGYTAIWKCLVKRELFEKFDIKFPNCHSEAKAIYPLLIALSNKVVNVREGLYFYRRFRKDSLTAKPRKNNGDEFAIGIRAFDELLKGFEKNGIYEEYEELLEEIVKYKLSDMLAGLYYRRDKEDYKRLVSAYREYIKKKFPFGTDYAYIILGGYNLNRILWNMNMLQDSYCRFNFSSLISIMHPFNENVEFCHKNNYRKLMIEKDLYSSFWGVLQEEKPRFICMDLLEERFDIIQYHGAYITKSDAWDGAKIELEQVRLIRRDSEECKCLWKESWNKFVSKLRKEHSNTKIILIKNFLCENWGNIYERHEYEEISSIKKKNQVIKEYYRYVEENYSEVIVVEASKYNYYITDEEYEYGTIPSHLNELVNREIACEVEKLMKSKK